MRKTFTAQAGRIPRHGFTLVEILGAILIISILAALMTVGGRAAMRFFRGVNDKATIDNIAKALELYKNKYGEYPPDGTDMAAVRRHLLKRDPDLANKPLADLLIEEIDWLRSVYISVFHEDPIESSALKTIQNQVRRTFGRELAVDEILNELPLVSENGQMLTYWLCGENWVLESRRRWAVLMSQVDDLNWIQKVTPYVFQNGESESIDLNPGFSSYSEVGTAHNGVNYNGAARALCNAKGYPVVYFRSNKTAKDGITRWLHEGADWTDSGSYELISYQNGEPFYNEVKDMSSSPLPVAPAAGEGFNLSSAAPYFPMLKAGAVEVAGLHPYRHGADHTGELWYAPDTYQLILPGEDGLYVPVPDDPATAKAELDNVTNFCAGATMAEEDFEGKPAGN